MGWFEGISSILLILLVVLVVIPLISVVFLYFLDRHQKQHAILRNFPILGRMRYILEKVGPEFRQYLFDDDHDGKPFNREDFLHIVLPGKYLGNVIGFGSKRDFNEAGFYIRNAMFTKQVDELHVDSEERIHTKKYVMDADNLFSRKEHTEEVDINPWLLSEDDAVVIGANCREPFHVRSLVGQSAMSYGALGKNAITALSKGIGMAKGSWMNTGEGGISEHHLAGKTDLIAQIGSGLFGYRTKDGEFSWEKLAEKAAMPHVKAFELKLAQGAKTRGGHVEAEKVTEEIANIRNIEPFVTINSPNRFRQFDDFPTLFEFIEKIREHGGLPVGIKIVVGSPQDADELAIYMKESGKGPDFISIDGAEGGTGATFQDLADGVGLPIHSGLVLLQDALVRHGVRDRVKIIASGKIITPDRAAVMLALGADLINIARGFMISVGCIMAQRCHSNDCPAGVATTNPKLQNGLIVDEKKYRVTNYIVSMREGLFRVAAAAGLDSPTKLSSEHIVYKDAYGRVFSVEELEKK
ncbi:FMN-binding glutamate synthase family protein [Viridibacillus arvi]|uniref:FMN-binding glutamate synthase family protein n=1 Tax=Viridibacillus arvi TaxID=263475 RepID=UPI00187B456C|nr:FMN-binding glutamate synthase family protein [Viridibacillus sp. JNUCC-6]QOV10491.1 FMN-binding glutamate synthase family protein [Viridibacillus sp. JNUCC-6]